MLRFLCLLILGISMSGCASREKMEELAAQRQEANRAAIKATVEAARIPPVNLSEQQIAKLKELSPETEIIWLGAGRQNDGTVFVCHAVAGKDAFGYHDVALFAGTFAVDGTYHRSWSKLMGLQGILSDCHAHGFDPPVSIHVTYRKRRMW